MPSFPKHLLIIGDDFIASALDPPQGLVDVAISRMSLYIPSFNVSNGVSGSTRFGHDGKPSFGTEVPKAKDA